MDCANVRTTPSGYRDIVSGSTLENLSFCYLQNVELEKTFCIISICATCMML